MSGILFAKMDTRMIKVCHLDPRRDSALCETLVREAALAIASPTKE